jgi:hypothetical protein
MNKHLFIALALVAVVISGCKEKKKEAGEALLCGSLEYRAEHPQTCKDWDKYFTPKKEAADLMKKLSE